MVVVDGKAFYSELPELVAVPHTALVIVDMQHDFVESNGAFGRLGLDLSMYSGMRGSLRRLLHVARTRGVLVIHLQMTAMPGSRSDSPAQLRFNAKLHRPAGNGAHPIRYCVAGSQGHAFVPDCAPEAGELVIPKWRSSGFAGTNLDMLLRSNAIESLVITGCTTEGCIESTARDALFADYYVIIPEDCVASDNPELHDASLLLMRHRFDVLRSAEIARVWSASEPPAGAARMDQVSYDA